MPKSDLPGQNIFGARSYKRNANDVKEEIESGYGRVLDYKSRKKVEMRWATNTEMHDHHMFSLKIGSEEVILNAEDFRRFLRYV